MLGRNLLSQRQRIIGTAGLGNVVSQQLKLKVSNSYVTVQSRSLFFKKKEKKLRFADRVVLKMQDKFSKIPTKYKFMAGVLFVVTFPGWVMWGIVEFVFEKIENI